MVAAASQLGKRPTRVQIVGGRLYAKVGSRLQGKSRIWYWLWGLQELLDKYPGRVPDVDLVMQTQDSAQCTVRGKPPKNKTLALTYQDYHPGTLHHPPPPVFSAVTTANDYDLLWPLWTIWGEDVQGASAKAGGFHDPNWGRLHGSLVRAARATPWRSRRASRPLWRGSVKTNRRRIELVNCGRGSEGASMLDVANVQHKEHLGKPVSAIRRTEHRYLIYMDGKTFSGGLLPMTPTGAILLIHPTEFVTLHTRAVMSTGYYAEFSAGKDMCQNISAVLQLMNDDEEGTAKKAAALLEWATAELSMRSVER